MNIRSASRLAATGVHHALVSGGCLAETAATAARTSGPATPRRNTSACTNCLRVSSDTCRRLRANSNSRTTTRRPILHPTQYRRPMCMTDRVQNSMDHQSWGRTMVRRQLTAGPRFTVAGPARGPWELAGRACSCVTETCGSSSTSTRRR